MGIIPLWLFRRRKKRSPCAIVVGDGKFKLYIASDANQRNELERLFGNRFSDLEHRCPALLTPRPAHPRGPDTVAVRIEDTTIGYLHPTGARVFLAALAVAGVERAACAATIEARWDPAVGERAYFRVRLDAVMPFHFFDPQLEMTALKRA
jgi:hypothetical protein